MQVEKPLAPWTHIEDACEAVAAAMERVGRRECRGVTIEIRWPTVADGCWCYVRSPRPHPHKYELGGCPITEAVDNYVSLVIASTGDTKEGGSDG